MLAYAECVQDPRSSEQNTQAISSSYVCLCLAIKPCDAHAQQIVFVANFVLWDTCKHSVGTGLEQVAV